MNGISQLPQHLQERLANELKAGETLVWTAQPQAGRRLRRGCGALAFFVPWTVLCLVLLHVVPREGASFLEKMTDLRILGGIAFLLVGLGGLSTPFWYWRKARSTVYAITNRRAIVIEGTQPVRIKSYLPLEFVTLDKTLRRDGSGSLVLRTEHYLDSDGDRRAHTEGFFDIAHLGKVEALLEILARANRQAATAPR